MLNRARVKGRRDPGSWISLRELREGRNLSQGELAALIGTSQPAVLKTENSTDPRLSTIRRYVEGIASSENVSSSVFITATIGDTEVRLILPHDPAGEDFQAETLAAPVQTPPLGGTRTAWRLRAWDDPELEVVWHDRRIISISDDEIGDLSVWPTEAELRTRLASRFTDRSPQAIGMFVTYWRYFVREMDVDDLVAVPQSRNRVAIGRITGDYRYDQHQADTRLRHQRDTEWLRTISRDELDDDIRKVVNAPGTICRIKATDAAARLLAR